MIRSPILTPLGQGECCWNFIENGQVRSVIPLSPPSYPVLWPRYINPPHLQIFIKFDHTSCKLTTPYICPQSCTRLTDYASQRIISKVCVSHWFSHQSHRISNLADDFCPRRPRVNSLILSRPSGPLRFCLQMLQERVVMISALSRCLASVG